MFKEGCGIRLYRFLTIAFLSSFQKRAARITLRADFMTCSKSKFRELQWLLFPLRVEYHSCIMIFKAMNNQTPEYISNLFTMASEFITETYVRLNIIYSESHPQALAILSDLSPKDGMLYP